MSKGKASQVVSNFVRNVVGADKSASVEREGGMLYIKTNNWRHSSNHRELIAVRALSFVFFNDEELIYSPMRMMLKKENAISLSAQQFNSARQLLEDIRKTIGKVIDNRNNFMDVIPKRFLDVLNHHGDELCRLGINWPIVESAHDVFRLYMEWLENSQYGYVLFYGGTNFTNHGIHDELRTLDIEKYKVRAPWIFFRDAHDAVLFTLGNDGVISYAIDES